MEEASRQKTVSIVHDEESIGHELYYIMEGSTIYFGSEYMSFDELEKEPMTNGDDTKDRHNTSLEACKSLHPF